MASLSDQGSPGSILRPNSRSSCAYVISPSCEASRLLSLNQLHRTSPGHEGDRSVMVDHGNETRPSPSPATLNLSSLREAKDVQSKSPHRAMHWKTIGIIIAFLLAALLSALGHYLLFRNLDGTLTDTAYLTQSQISAVSVLLTTIFKAALTSSTGICFAQHLWFVLRGNVMSLSAVEKLFVLRSNILVLGDLRSIWRAPLLFLMALLIWCLGLATIYPPGALIVTFEAHNYTENRNISVMNPPVPQDFDLVLGFPNLGHYKWDTTPGNASEVLNYRGTSEVLTNIARSIITVNQVFDLLVHPGENSTYNMQFRAPQYQCTVSQRNRTIPLEHGTIPIEPTGLSTDIQTESILTGVNFSASYQSEAQLFSVSRGDFHNIITKHNLDNTTTYEALMEVTEQSCTPYSMLYNVDISFPRGIRTITHTISNPKTLPNMDNIYDKYDLRGPWGIYLDFPAKPHALEEWHQRIIAALPVFNEWAILEALGVALDFKWYKTIRLYPRMPCDLKSTFENGTTIQVCRPETFSGEPPPNNNTLSPLAGTVFDKEQFDTKGLPHLTFTEDILNSVLTNLTLSAISLGTWWDIVPVTTTHFQSTYSFANPLNLILPYSICLTAGAIFAILAIWSLWRNGIPAADGGFLQIMMATRGNTEMERLVLKERLMTTDGMSKELSDLKIRYGELGGEDVLGVEGRRLGFGTVEETVSLRKRR